MVVWKKDSTLISAGSTKVIRDSRVSIVGTSLDISKVSSKDSGNYTCEINTDVPSHINIVLNVLGESCFHFYVCLSVCPSVLSVCLSRLIWLRFVRLPNLVWPDVTI